MQPPHIQWSKQWLKAAPIYQIQQFRSDQVQKLFRADDRLSGTYFVPPRRFRAEQINILLGPVWSQKTVDPLFFFGPQKAPKDVNIPFQNEIWIYFLFLCDPQKASKSTKARRF